MRTAGVNKYDECSQSRSEHVTHPLVELKVNLDLDRKGQDQHTMINHGEIDSSQRKGIGFTVVGSETSRKLINVGKTTTSAQLEHCDSAITPIIVSWTRQEVRRQLPPLIKASRHGLSHLMSRIAA